MATSTGNLNATAGNSRAVLFNYLGACGAGVLTGLGMIAYSFGGFFGAFPGALLTIVSGPPTIAFLLAAVWWKCGWPHAGVVQLLPFLWILGWAALILLSPVQTHSPAP